MGRQNTVRKIVLSSSRSVYGEGKYECPRCGVVYPKGREKDRMLAGLLLKGITFLYYKKESRIIPDGSTPSQDHRRLSAPSGDAFCSPCCPWDACRAAAAPSCFLFCSSRFCLALFTACMASKGPAIAERRIRIQYHGTNRSPSIHPDQSAAPPAQKPGPCRRNPCVSGRRHIRRSSPPPPAQPDRS